MKHDPSTCAWCPRLCRHVCPVAVATGLESATPTALQTLLLLASEGRVEPAQAAEAAELCNGCGACTTFCKHHVPVADAMRAVRGPPPAAAPLADIEGDAPLVCVLAEDAADWASDYAAAHGAPVARLRTPDALGHDAWRAGDADVPRRIAAHLRGRTAVTDQLDTAAILEAAGIPTLRLQAPDTGHRFTTCFETADAHADHQLACCGRRERFPVRRPTEAAAVARENARRLADASSAGAVYACSDAACARWLSSHGASVIGPDPRMTSGPPEHRRPLPPGADR